ncbi:MAG: metal ABC transporter substrate-binding protein [Beijerinckiaceae bacterium]
MRLLSKRDVFAGALAMTAMRLAAPAFAQEKLKAVASFSIIGDFVREVGGDRILLTTLVGPNGDAHVYSPSPADGAALAQAKVIFVNGLRFESWLERLVKASGASAPIVVAAAKVAPLRLEADKAHDHDHGKVAVDPHAWQSIANAKLYVAAIRDGLIAADPPGRAVYEANAAAYAARLDEVQAEVTASIARIPSARRKLITSHDAFGYFAKAYGVAFIAPKGVSTETEATAKDVARIIRQVRAEKIPAVFMENIQDRRLAEQIARETGAKIGGALFSDALSPPDGPAPTYIDLMRRNVRQIVEALAPGGA